MRQLNFLLLCAILSMPVVASAKGGAHHAAASPGTGSKVSSEHVKSYVKKGGTIVAPHEKSTPDKKFENNWTTKGNTNRHTGKEGTRVTESPKK